MNTRDYSGLFHKMMQQYGMLQENLVFVENISVWCKEHGIDEPDKQRPVKFLINDCMMLISEDIPDRVIEERINAMSIRTQLLGLAFDRAEMLDSDEKRLAYLFLSEYAVSVPEAGDDELQTDSWSFQEMEKLGYFKK